MTDPHTSLTGLRFAKGHGTGNDFVLLADPDDDRDLTGDQVAFLCDRHRGIGGDGLIRAVRSRHVPEGREVLAENPAAEWFMDYRNGDGSLSEMCGNGVRVFVHFLLNQGLAVLHPGQELAIGTRGGVKVVARTEDGYRVDMGPWEFIFPEHARTGGMDSLVDTPGLGVSRAALSISMGNPHTVVALADPGELAAARLAEPPAVTPAPPHGTNVEFTVPAEPLVHEGVGRITMRVHERGVGETLSCGTGACAAAAATRFWAQDGAGAGVGERGTGTGAGGADNGVPDVWRVDIPGGTVGVRFFPGADGREHVELSGPAVIVADGVLA